jgi:hypothetical protein
VLGWTKSQQVKDYFETNSLFLGRNVRLLSEQTIRPLSVECHADKISQQGKILVKISRDRFVGGRIVKAPPVWHFFILYEAFD